MKRTLFPLLCAAVIALAAVGCASSEPTNDVDLSSIADTIEAYDPGSYTALDISGLKTLYDIDSGDVKQFVAQTKDDNFGIVMIEATSRDAANRIAEKLTSYLGQFSRAELDKVIQIGNYVALFSSSRQGAADQMAAAFSDIVSAEE